jgi:hypothetical protein
MDAETYVDLHHGAIDYLTLTTWDSDIWRFWNMLFTRDGYLRRLDSKIPMYVGQTYYRNSGSCFVGQGEQKGMAHYIIKISGSLAEELKAHAFNQRKAHQVTCTRVDLQVTIPEPKGWSQIDLLTRTHKTGKIPGWQASKDSHGGKLETVYIGSWHDERFSTVYIKLTAGNERLLRFETRYKNPRAEPMLRMLGEGELADNFLRHELEKIIKDKPLHGAFVSSLVNGAPISARVQIKQQHHKTQEWLLDKILPTFARIILDHDSDGAVYEAFAKVMEKVHE